MPSALVRTCAALKWPNARVFSPIVKIATLFVVARQNLHMRGQFSELLVYVVNMVLVGLASLTDSAYFMVHFVSHDLKQFPVTLEQFGYFV